MAFFYRIVKVVWIFCWSNEEITPAQDDEHYPCHCVLLTSVAIFLIILSIFKKELKKLFISHPQNCNPQDDRNNNHEDNENISEIPEIKPINIVKIYMPKFLLDSENLDNSDNHNGEENKIVNVNCFPVVVLNNKDASQEDNKNIKDIYTDTHKNMINISKEHISSFFPKDNNIQDCQNIEIYSCCLKNEKMVNVNYMPIILPDNNGPTDINTHNTEGIYSTNPMIKTEKNLEYSLEDDITDINHNIGKASISNFVSITKHRNTDNSDPQKNRTMQQSPSVESFQRKIQEEGEKELLKFQCVIREAKCIIDSSKKKNSVLKEKTLVSDQFQLNNSQCSDVNIGSQEHYSQNYSPKFFQQTNPRTPGSVKASTRYNKNKVSEKMLSPAKKKESFTSSVKERDNIIGHFPKNSATHSVSESSDNLNQRVPNMLNNITTDTKNNILELVDNSLFHGNTRGEEEIPHISTDNTYLVKTDIQNKIKESLLYPLSKKSSVEQLTKKLSKKTNIRKNSMEIKNTNSNDPIIDIDMNPPIQYSSYQENSSSSNSNIFHEGWNIYNSDAKKYHMGIKD